MKHKSLIFPFLFTLFLTISGCTQSSQNNEDDNTPKIEERIVLNGSKVNLTISETFLLQIAYSNVDASFATSFTSSDTSVVTVNDNGLVTGLAEGKANVTVLKGNASAECAFTVSLAGEIPYIFIEGIKNNNLEIDSVSDYELEPVVKLGNHNYPIEDLKYEIIPGSGNGEIINNVFHPTQSGDLFIKISGSYSGHAMHSYYLSVIVKDSVIFTLRDEDEGLREYGSVYLYTMSEYRGKTYQTTFKPKMSIYINGEDKSNTDDFSFEFIDENHILTYDSTNNIITPTSVGKASLRMHYQDYQKDFDFYINYLVAESDYEEEIIIDASIGEFPNEEIFADFTDDNQIVKATSVDQSKEYSVLNGKVIDIESHNFAQQQIILYNHKIGFIVDFKAYAMIIRQPEDLSVFNITVENEYAVDGFRNDGYYLLANDLDCTGITYQESTRVLGRGANTLEQTCGFVGTFDGQGHTISNFVTPREGLFLVLGMGAVIKNVAFKDAILDVNKGNDRFVLATYCYGATLNNVYINSSSDFGTKVNNALVAGCMSNSCHLVNCIFEYTGSFTATKAIFGFGSFTHLNELGVPQFSSTYIISPCAMTVCWALFRLCGNEKC